MPDLPPIHLINLDRSTERLHRFQERNFHLPKIVRVPAVDGSALDREELIRAGVINRDLPYAAGTLGCAMSHLSLWKMAASQNQDIRSSKMILSSPISSKQGHKKYYPWFRRIGISSYGDTVSIHYLCGLTKAFQKRAYSPTAREDTKQQGNSNYSKPRNLSRFP